MIPDTGMRLKAMLRSVTEVIVPALHPTDRIALEHAALLAVNLESLLQQYDHSYEFEFTELADQAGFVRELLSITSGHQLDATTRSTAVDLLAAADSIVARPIAPQQRLTDLSLSLRQICDDLVRDSFRWVDDANLRALIERSVLKHGGRQLDRRAQWFNKGTLSGDYSCW